MGKRKRELCGIFLNYFYALGEAAVALFAWGFGTWRLLQLAVSAPAFVFLCYYWFVPESVRWLLARNEHTKAKHIVSEAARINKVVLSAHILESMEVREHEEVTRRLDTGRVSSYPSLWLEVSLHMDAARRRC